VEKYDVELRDPPQLLLMRLQELALIRLQLLPPEPLVMPLQPLT
jgi:hypothetical protein